MNYKESYSIVKELKKEALSMHDFESAASLREMERDYFLILIDENWSFSGVKEKYFNETNFKINLYSCIIQNKKLLRQYQLELLNV